MIKVEGLYHAGFMVYLTLKKPPKIWGIGKIEGFVKFLGLRGAELFFYAFLVIAVVLGIWLFTIKP